MHESTPPVGNEPATITRRQLLIAGSIAGAGVVLSTTTSAASTRLTRPRTPTPRVELDDFIRQRMKAGRLPGLSAAIVSGGSVGWTRGYGLANVWRGQRVRPDTPFMLASISKTVICTAVMQAVEDGLFALDDDINDLLAFPVRLPARPHMPITIRHLLTHTSGILDRWAVWDDLYSKGDSRVPLGAFLRDYLVRGRRYYRRANFARRDPGSKYAYSNVGAALAAYVVEVASGTGFDRWCDERIFGPLGMARTGWHLADLPAAEVAMPYHWSRADDRFEAIGQYGYPDYPDGALRATARSVATHLGMMMHGGRWHGARVLDAASVGESLRPQLAGITPGQGLIWYRFRLRGRELWGHNGGDSGVATEAFFDPREGVGVVVLANGDWRRSATSWPLQQIMMRLFDEAPRLT